MNELLRVLHDANELMCENEIYWFRGQADATHKLVPSVFRPRQDGSYYDEAKLLKEFVRQHPEAREKHSNTFELLTYAQHYGLPTRLLDWTKNLLVAIFFACKDKNDVDGKVFFYALTDELETAQYRYNTYENFVTSTNPKTTYLDMVNAIPLLRGTEFQPIYLNNKPLFNNQEPINLGELAFIKHHRGFLKLFTRIGKSDSHGMLSNDYEEVEVSPMSISIPYEPVLLNKRLITQQGVFTIHGGKIIARTTVVSVLHMEEERCASGRIRHLLIPESQKSNILQQLEILGISESILFPELEYQTRHIKDKCVNFPEREFNPEDF